MTLTKWTLLAALAVVAIGVAAIAQRNTADGSMCLLESHGMVFADFDCDGEIDTPAEVANTPKVLLDGGYIVEE